MDIIYVYILRIRCECNNFFKLNPPWNFKFLFVLLLFLFLMTIPLYNEDYFLFKVLIVNKLSSNYKFTSNQREAILIDKFS